ncbi:MAG: ATP-dependent DNA helicase RecG [Chloroflexi bacterium]|nr:ATP-dependent DNA helicase RecG [Chloroflexota bacterium]
MHLQAIVDLGRGLRAERDSGYQNTIHPDGLDAFVDDWLCTYHTLADDADLKPIVTAIRGYYAWEHGVRVACINEAIAVLRTLYRRYEPQSHDAPVAAHAPAPPAPPAHHTTLHAAPEHAVTPAPAPPVTPAPRKSAAKRNESAPHDGPITLNSPLKVVPGITPSLAQAFSRIGVKTIRDMLHHYPFRYDDFSKRITIDELRPGQVATVIANITEVKSFTMRNGSTGVNVQLEDETGMLKIVFFGQRWLLRQLKPEMTIMVSGKVDSFGGIRQMSSPDWQPYQPLSADELLHVGRMVPVHPLTKGLAERSARTTIKRIIDNYADLLADPLPVAVRQRTGLIDLVDAIKRIHFPATPEDVIAARTRLGFDEFLTIQLGVLQRKINWQGEPGYAMPYNDDAHAALLAALPFALTNAQNRALGEIFADIAAPIPMARLLQGDVGSGKTAVAAAAALQTVANGYQAAIMAPTEILAEQHYRGLSALLGNINVRRSNEWQELLGDNRRSRLAEIQQLLGMDPNQSDGVRIALLTGSLGTKERRRVLEGVARGEVDLVVGTHALISEGVQYLRLGLVVVDEQHRFGVEQRQRLKDKGHNPHMLVMTATPIPRTLTMTIYGDLDTSILDELPPGRQQITTKRITNAERHKAYNHIRKQVATGRQVFVICPLVEESDKSDLPSAEEMYEKLQSDVFKDLRVSLIHGKMSAKDKDAIMVAFRNHEADILVATAVIEVGIDIPNASTMMIEGADRFGLAQLHQFRGRVGRGPHKSYCILVSDRDNETTNLRLDAMVASSDGFILAEKDLEIRGPGEFFGTRQSGMPDLKIAQLTDMRLLQAAQLEAKTILREDPELALIQHALLRSQVEAFWARAVDAN